jgi:uncharacterized protein (DUF1015 family)
VAEIAPFRGLRYDAARAGELGRLFAPPYDVIDNAMRERLIGRSPYNIARVTRSPEADSEPEAVRYTAAAKLLAEWRKSGVLAEDRAPAFYAYEEEFAVAGRTFHRLGLVVGLKLVDFGQGVHPHEETLSGPKADRRLLLEKTRTHLGQIFGLYPDEAGQVNAAIRAAIGARAPDGEARDDDGVVHRLWALSDPDVCGNLAALVRPRDIFIADGHHRYEVALRYSREHPELPKAKHVMATLVALSDPGLVILPTHRLVFAVAGFDLSKLESALGKDFMLTSYPFTAKNRDARLAQLLGRLKECAAAGENAFGLYGGGGRFTEVVLKDGAAMKSAEPKRSEAWRSLDVAVLHSLILEKLLGIDKARLAAHSNLDYLKDTGAAIGEAIARIDAGEAQCVFVMNPTGVAQVAAVASGGEKMPQKSTFFPPKIFTGMVAMPVE